MNKDRILLQKLKNFEYIVLVADCWDHKCMENHKTLKKLDRFLVAIFFFFFNNFSNFNHEKT